MSPLLFNVYMDDLSVQLKGCNTGCVVGNTLCNHLMYADDLVLISLYSAGMQKLLNICSSYGDGYDFKFNALESQMMIVRTKADKYLSFPDFYLCDKVLHTLLMR